MDLTKISNEEVASFLRTFFTNRNINKDFFKLLPNNKLDFRLVDSPNRKSDSPRESLIHLIEITRAYTDGIKTGGFDFNVSYPDLKNLVEVNKTFLLELLDNSEQDLVDTLSTLDIEKTQVKVSWSKDPVPILLSLWGMNNHEILHTGWNIAIMDVLDMPRFDSLKKVWG